MSRLRQRLQEVASNHNLPWKHQDLLDQIVDKLETVEARLEAMRDDLTAVSRHLNQRMDALEYPVQSPTTAHNTREETSVVDTEYTGAKNLEWITPTKVQELLRQLIAWTPDRVDHLGLIHVDNCLNCAAKLAVLSYEFRTHVLGVNGTNLTSASEEFETYVGLVQAGAPSQLEKCDVIMDVIIPGFPSKEYRCGLHKGHTGVHWVGS